MNNIFNYRRFSKYFVYDLKRWLSSYGMTFLLLSMMPLILHFIVLGYSMAFGQGYHVPGIEARAVVFCIITFLLVLTYPANVYGFITEKKAGTTFLMIPASLTEKFVSMILNTVLVLPVSFAFIYLMTDAVLTAIFPDTGGALIASFTGVLTEVMTLLQNGAMHLSIFSLIMNFISNILFFLLCAITFRKHKVLYPILILIGIQMLIGLFAGVFMFMNTDCIDLWFNQFIDNPDSLISMLSAYNVVSAIFNIIVILALGTAVFYRLKTIKH